MRRKKINKSSREKIEEKRKPQVRKKATQGRKNLARKYLKYLRVKREKRKRKPDAREEERQ